MCTQIVKTKTNKQKKLSVKHVMGIFVPVESSISQLANELRANVIF